MSELGLDRDHSLLRLRERAEPWDILVIGGGASGVGIALDAASRGLDVILVEQSDFGKGTSSRSTKLVHGGVRYLRQGNITLVRDALRERTLLRINAPHVVHDLPFLIPCHSTWERFFYGVGLKIYDFLATRNSFGRSRGVSLAESIRLVPSLRHDAIRGGVIYHDGQFDDTRLLIDMAITASDHGACLLNHFGVTGLIAGDDGKLVGAQATDRETNETHRISAKCIVNATGPFCDSIRKLDDVKCADLVAASQGVHLVLSSRFLPSETAIIVPKTSDGRVIFVIPWLSHTLIGTTDTPIDAVTLEPAAMANEIDFLLETAARYLKESPTRDDVMSVFTGIRPLVKGDPSARTASLSRDHVVKVSPSGLVTITGGKWTTVRKMAEDCVDRAISVANLPNTPCKTQELAIRNHSQFNDAGTAPLDGSSVTESFIEFAVKHQMARTVEDVLARRSRLLFLNAKEAIAIAPLVARSMARTLNRDETWIASQVTSFNATAKHYLP